MSLFGLSLHTGLNRTYLQEHKTKENQIGESETELKIYVIIIALVFLQT